MLEKKGVSPVQCQTATSGGNGVGSGGGGGSASGAATANTPQSQQSITGADVSNGLESNVLPQNRTSGSAATNLNSASMNNTNSAPNTPNDKMGALTAQQDFVIIKSEDQKTVPTNHCVDAKSKLNSDSNAIQSQLRNVNTNDSKLNTTNANLCGTRGAINNNNNNNIKCRDSVTMSCASNGPLNGPLNGICSNNTSPLNILNDGKLSSLTDELGMPVASGNVTMSSGDLPPLSMMSQTMNMPGPRGHCGQPPPQGPHLGINVSSNPILHPHSHNNMHHLVSNNNNNNNNIGPQKASMTMDSQYMQQQSQIFVFNTQMANRAAEAVDSGQFSSIIDFHCSNPETKRLLEKYPMKPQFNRTSSAAWLNNLAQIKQGGRGMKPNLANTPPGMHPSMLNSPFGQPRGQLPPPGSCVGSCNMHNQSGMPSGPGPGGGAPNNWSNNPNVCSNPNWSAQQQQQTQQQMFAQNSDMNPSHKFPNSPMGTGPRACGPNFGANNNFQNNPQMFSNASPICNPGQGMPPQMAGPEVPDENLTPQQRQHREKQLAILRKMQQQLCPEMMESSPMPMNQMMRMPAPHQTMDYMMDPSMCTNNMCPPEHEHLHNSDPSINNLMTPSTMIANNNNNTNTNTTQYSQSHSSMPPTSASAQIEWQKVQNNYMDERRRKPPTSGQVVHNNSVPISHHSPLSQPSSTMNSPSPCISQSPGSRIPPPPYNQGIRPHSSPHPSSPATGSLPMPSPRMQSPADASRQQFTPAGQSRLPHTSPGPATPSADSNSSISGTGVHSPKPLPSSTSQNSLPSATSSSVVQNSCNVSRTQTSTNVTNLTNISVTTPSNIAPCSSPSSVKKLPNNVNLMSQTPKPLNPDCGDLLINPLSNSGLDPNRKLHPNDISMLGPNNSPFICNKQEPALMPVPSPQQIQYLNAFEGQELTIQKQPNTSLRDADLISPAPDLDLGFPGEFGNNCQPFHGNERLPNFAMMDSMNTRFPNNPQQTGNMSGGPQFDMNPRFMTPDNNSQRFVGPAFDGPSPRMPNSHDNQFRPQNMLCMPYGQMENNMMRFPNSCDTLMPPRIRGPTDMGMNPRFPQHMNDNMQSPSHFNSSTMSPMSNDQMNMMPFTGSNQASGPGCLGPVGNFNPQMESGISSTHLQNLQKMTPPFDIGPPNKVDGMMMPNGSMQHNHNANNQVMHGPNGPMVQVSQSQRSANFDPISSMAAMGEPNSANQMNPQPNMMSGSSMNMTSMQVASNGPPPGNMVNFHTAMSSMQGIHQNMSPDGNGMNGGGMQNQYGMPQMGHNMTGGPQTVNNTYVNATMSIQQLNIQNVPTPNFNPNMDQSMSNQNSMNIPPPSIAGGGPGMSPPSNAMQMMQQNSSAKLGPGFGHRMSGPAAGPNFAGQQMNNPRVMSPMNYQTSPHMMQRCSYNSANIQVKPDAPNTIQYLPARPQNSNPAQRAPSLDFLQRFEPPLTNLGNKLPTHNLQYFPNNNANINNNQGMPLQPRMVPQNMSMASGPGRPGGPMVRGPNPNSGIVPGQQPIMPSADMFGRPPGPNNMMNGPHMGSAQPNAMFSNMKQSGSGPMSPDAAQPLPPSVGHSYNYKQPFVPSMSSDPNYAIQFHNFQQQLYATNTRTSNNTANTNTANNNPRMPSNNFYSSSK